MYIYVYVCNYKYIKTQMYLCVYFQQFSINTKSKLNGI